MKKKSFLSHLHLSEKFIFIAGASLVPAVIYLNRFLIPDSGFDSLYYHIFNGLRGSQNYLWFFSKQEFYPIGWGDLVPIYDYMFYLARITLGYRLGTILGLLAYVGIIYITWKLIDRVVKIKTKINPFLKFIFFVNAIVVTELLFQIATQYVDIVDVFFVLLALYFFIIYLEKRNYSFLWISSVLFGLTFLAKLTNGIYLVPFYIILVADTLTSKDKNWSKKTRLLFIVGIIVLLPVLVYDSKNFILTGNPVFPMFNNIFKSPYSWPISYSSADAGIGGQNLFQQLLWPVASFWHASRLAEPHNIFNDWKLGVYWLISLVLFVPRLWKRLNKNEKYLIVFFFISTEIWGLEFGVIRYAATSIVLGGVIFLMLFTHLRPLLSRKQYIFLCLPIIALLLIDNYRIVAFNLKYDMAWRPNFVHNTSLYLSQSNNLFDNYLSYPKNTLRYLTKSQIALDCVPQSSGLIALSGYANKPVLNIMSEAPSEAITQQILYRKVTAQILFNAFHHNTLTFYTFSRDKDVNIGYKACLANIAEVGGSVERVVHLNSFLGYSSQKPVVIFGKINLQTYVNSAQKKN